MRVLTALKWTRCLNKSLIKATTIDPKFTSHAIMNRDIHCRTKNPVLTNGTNDGHTVSASRYKQSTRGFSMTIPLAKSKDREKKKKSGKAQAVNINELSEFINTEKLTSEFEKAIEDMKVNFVKHLTLRSSTGAIEQLAVSFEGQDYELQELVDIARKPKTVILNVGTFPQAIPQILESLSKSGMNLNPQQDGTTIFIPIPKVTREHRENLSKNAKSMYIKSRDSLKEIRNKQIRNVKKVPSISEDSVRRVQAQLETMCDQYISEAEKILEAKQKDLLGSSD